MKTCDLTFATEAGYVDLFATELPGWGLKFLLLLEIPESAMYCVGT